MHFYFARGFTSQVTGRRLKHVTCEKCQMAFQYELTRTGKGKSDAPYFLGQRSAETRAESRARRDLEKRLEDNAEMVPCPKCGWVNVDLVRRYRKRQYLRLPRSSALIVLAGLMLAVFTGHTLAGVFGRTDTLSLLRAALVVLCLLSPVWIFGVRSWLRGRIDPNKEYPRLPFVPLGTPPALIERVDPVTGATHLEAVPNRYVNAELMASWAVYRAGQVAFPRVCCVCMAPASTEYSTPFTLNRNSNMQAPLCKACSSKIRRRWWRISLAVAAATFGVAALLAMTLPGAEGCDRWTIFPVLLALGVPAGVAVLSRLYCRPYRLGRVDADRGIWKFRAYNRSYTELLIDQVRRSNGEA